MVLSDQVEKLKVIKTWFGQKLNLKCDVIHSKNTEPVFKWYKKSLTKSTFEDLFAPNNSNALIIEKVNQTDFGEYSCEARTRMAHVVQRFNVTKLGTWVLFASL